MENLMKTIYWIDLTFDDDHLTTPEFIAVDVPEDFDFVFDEDMIEIEGKGFYLNPIDVHTHPDYPDDPNKVYRLILGDQEGYPIYTASLEQAKDVCKALQIEIPIQAVTVTRVPFELYGFVAPRNY
jgi:hypothetical protein